VSAPQEVTGERLVPDRQHGELVHAEHMARYVLTAQLAHGRRALDAACGEGYGTELLRRAGAKRAVGIDVDEGTVRAARERYGAEFEVAAVERLPFGDAAFDLIASFETIEHVENAEAAVRELRRVLSPGGTLVISTPNASQYLVDNEFHVREFETSEFVQLLERHFAEVRVLHQQNWLTSAILAPDDLREATCERELELEVRKVAGAEPGRELYAVALCGAQACASLRQVAVMSGIHEAHELARRLREAERTAERWHTAFKETEGHLRWVVGTWSWKLTRPFRMPGRLRRRRGG